MSNEKNSGRTILTTILTIAEIVFLAVIAFRKFIFPSDSLFYNLYEESLAGDSVVRIIKTLVILCVGILLFKLARKITEVGSNFSTSKAKTSALLMGNALRYVSAIVIIFVTLSTWGIDTTAIATGAGVITLILGLGCQSMIADVVAGIFLLFEDDIRVGDVVVVDGWRGTVEQIGLRRTKIVDVAGNVNIVNNSAITNIVNNTRRLSISVCEVPIYYDESIPRVENALRNNMDWIRQEIPAIVDGPYYIGVSELANTGVLIQLIAYVQEEDKYQTERDLNRIVKLLFDQYRIGIPHSQVMGSADKEAVEEFHMSEEEALEAKQFLEEQRTHTKYYSDVNK